MAGLLGLGTRVEKKKKDFEIELPDEIKSTMSEIEVEPVMLDSGDRLMDLSIPEHTLVVMVKRQGAYFVPTGKTHLTVGDKLLVISDSERDVVDGMRQGIENDEEPETETVRG